MTTLSKQGRSYLPWLLSAVVLFLILVIGLPFADAAYYRNKIYPGVRVGSLDLGGMTKREAESAITAYTDSFLNKEISVNIGDVVKGKAPLKSFLSFDVPYMVTYTMSLGREGNWKVRLENRIGNRIKPYTIAPTVVTNDDAINSFIKDHAQNSSLQGLHMQNAHFQFVVENNIIQQITVAEAVSGFDLETEQLTFSGPLISKAQSFDARPILIPLFQKEPSLQRSDLEPLLPQVSALLARTPPEITWQEKKWTIDTPTFASWITAEKNEDRVTLAIDKEKVAAWLETIAKEIEVPANEPVFELSPDGKKAVKFSLGKSGIELPRAENIDAIAAGLLAGTTPILTTKELGPTFVTPQGAEIFGIKELVGRGITNFKGSPPNRIKNIKRAAELLNGLLIKPGEELSTINAVSPITLENGYFPEFVIKPAEGKTVKEVGGGLCQIGTTMFRAALNAGLPITMRANHSYRVSWYEPPIGMDATIYDPLPDLRFINDTGNWLILTTKVEGTTLTFDLWGTKDGRKAITTDPLVSNFVQPPPSKLIETTELAPGKKKCTEHPHVGSDAKFTYTVTYADGTVKTKEFKSHYRPWQEVCLIGIPPPEQLSPSPPAIPGDTLPATLPSADAEGAKGNTTTP